MSAEPIALGEFNLPASADDPPLAGEQLRMRGIAAEVAANTCAAEVAVWRLAIAAVDLRTRERAEAAYERWVKEQAASLAGSNP
jgi:hypothetical protein